jgi:hypothetical protein
MSARVSNVKDLRISGAKYPSVPQYTPLICSPAKVQTSREEFYIAVARYHPTNQRCSRESM